MDIGLRGQSRVMRQRLRNVVVCPIHIVVFLMINRTELATKRFGPQTRSSASPFRRRGTAQGKLDKHTLVSTL